MDHKKDCRAPPGLKFETSTSKTKLWSKWNVHANFHAFITKCTNKLPIHYTTSANDLGFDDLKQVRLRAYPVKMSRVKKSRFNAKWYQRWN